MTSSQGSSRTSHDDFASQTPLSSQSTGLTALDPAVIVGLACRVPGAENATQLWENIEAQVDLRQKVPSDRFNVDAFYHPDGTKKGTVRTDKCFLRPLVNAS